MHFEKLWEKSEAYHKELSKDDSVDSIINELIMKLNLYLMINNKELSKEDKENVKSRTMGEILYTLTNLSLKDNINVFESLSIALLDRIK